MYNTNRYVYVHPVAIVSTVKEKAPRGNHIRFYSSVPYIKSWRL